MQSSTVRDAFAKARCARLLSIAKGLSARRCSKKPTEALLRVTRSKKVGANRPPQLLMSDADQKEPSTYGSNLQSPDYTIVVRRFAIKPGGLERPRLLIESRRPGFARLAGSVRRACRT